MFQNLILDESVHTLTLTKRWQHHSASGGYDTLAKYCATTTISREENSELAFRLFKKLLWKWWKPPVYNLHYTLDDLIVEQKAILNTLGGTYDIVHCLYGEEQLKLLLNYRLMVRAKLVATFHLPWWRMEERFNRMLKHFDRLDGFVAVSSDLAFKLAEKFGGHRVCYIPHGIDTDVFRPHAQEKPDRLQLLTVGFHMRDMDAISRLASECQKKSIPVDFHYIGPQEYWSSFNGCNNVTCETDIAEQELIVRYQQSHALLLPIISATANNSLLEALACGLPVISTDIGGIPDYLDSASGWLLPPDNFDALLELITSLAGSPDICRSKETAARAKAETFAWPVVAEQLQKFYSVIANC